MSQGSGRLFLVLCKKKFLCVNKEHGAQRHMVAQQGYRAVPGCRDLERSPGWQLWIMRDIPLMMSQAEGMLQGCGGGGSEK